MCLATSNNLLLVLWDAPFFFHELAISWSAKKTKQRHFFPTLHSLSPVILQLQQWWHLYCLAIVGSTSIVIHSVKQRQLRDRPGSDDWTAWTVRECPGLSQHFLLKIQTHKRLKRTLFIRTRQQSRTLAVILVSDFCYFLLSNGLGQCSIIFERIKLSFKRHL